MVANMQMIFIGIKLELLLEAKFISYTIFNIEIRKTAQTTFETNSISFVFYLSSFCNKLQSVNYIFKLSLTRQGILLKPVKTVLAMQFLAMQNFYINLSNIRSTLFKLNLFNFEKDCFKQN